MKKIVIALTLALFSMGVAHSQEPPRKLHNVEILDLKGEPAMLPKWGEKNLMIFYIDPDRAGQNKDFTDMLEDTRIAEHSDIFGFGIINLKDAPFIPNGLARSMAHKRTERNGATVLADQTRTVSSEWNLGDCNNKFAVLLVNKDLELLYFRKGLLSDDDKVEFLKVIESWKQR